MIREDKFNLWWTLWLLAVNKECIGKSTVNQQAMIYWKETKEVLKQQFEEFKRD